MTQSANYFNSDNFLKGNIGKNVVKFLLERSKYEVCLYGYEDTLPDVKAKLKQETNISRNSDTGRRIRSSPDLLVYDDQNIMLVEVKTRGKAPKWIGAGRVRIRSGEIKPLKEFWSDSILVIVVPEGNVFYAQEIGKLTIQQNDFYSLEDFEKLQAIFKKVNSEDISHYRDIALQTLQTFMTKKEKALENTPVPSPEF